MLESMRNLAKTLPAKIMLGLLVLAFGVWGISGIAGSAFESALSLTGWGPKDLAQVGSITINGDQFTSNLQRQIKTFAAQSGQAITLADAHTLGIDKQVLDDMVSQAAVAGTATKLNLAVSEQVIRNELAGEKSFQDNKGQFDRLAFGRVLQNHNMSEASYFDMQRRIHTENAVLDAAAAEATLPKVFTQAMGQYQGETRDVKYFDVSASEADIAKPTDADLEAQYKKAPASYTAPEYRTAALMSIDTKALAASQTVSADELQAAYDKYQKDYFMPEKRSIIQLTFPSMEAAQKAKDRITGGEDILKIAGEMNLKDTDVTLPDKVKQDFIDQKIGDSAFALTEGQVSDPVQGSLAIVILKAAKVANAKQPTLDEVKGQLTERLQLDKARVQLQQVYNDVEDARAQSMKFEDIAKKTGLNLTMLPHISASGQNQDGTDLTAVAKADVLKAIFASDVGVESDAIGGSDGYTWYDVRSILPSALKPLEQVRTQVTQDVINQRVRTAAIEKALKIVDSLKGGKSIDAAAQESGAQIKTAIGLRRNQQTAEIDGPALEAAYSVADQGFAAAPGGDGKTARVLQVAKVVMPSVMASSPELDQMKQQMKSGFDGDLRTGLVASLKKQIGVKINDALWKQNTGGDAPPAE